MKQSLSDDELLRLIANNDLEAFNTIYKKHNKNFIFFADRILKNKEKAEEIIQDFWIKLIKFATRYIPCGHFVAWSYTIIKNQCINSIKTKEESLLRESDPFSDEYSDFNDPLENKIDMEESLTSIYQIINDLNPIQKSCLTFWLHSSENYDDISRALGVPISAVKTNLFRAKLQIRKKIHRA